MSTYLIQRLFGAVVVLLMVTVAVFFSVRLAPGDICATILGVEPQPGQCSAIDRELGLDRPALIQYVDYLGGVLTGDLGESYYRRTPLASELADRLPLTLEIASLSMLLAIMMGLPLGIISASRQNTSIDDSARLASIVALSLPSFWVATFAIIFPAIWWSYAPPSGYVDVWRDPFTNLEQLFLPTIAASLYPTATVARMTRSAMVEVMRQDYMRTATAKGLSSKVVVLQHGLRNALLPVITLASFQFGVLLGGTAVLESIFALPGMGSLAVQAVREKDYPVIQGIVLVSAAIVVLINLVVDLSYAWLDPRIRFT